MEWKYKRKFLVNFNISLSHKMYTILQLDNNDDVSRNKNIKILTDCNWHVREQ